MAKVGRPTLYNDDLVDRLCAEIAGSEEGLVRICESQEDFPAPRTVYRWLDENEEFRRKYARAREEQADYHADMILEIADDARNDFIMHSEEGGPEWAEFRAEHVQRSKLRVEARKWKASKIAPKKYGDRVVNEHEPLTVTIQSGDADL